MKIEHLIATVNNDDFELCESMNIKCDAIIANQSNKTNFKEKKIDDNLVKIVTTNTKGVGINRNLGIMYSSGDICILSDDDMIYNEDYISIVEEAFKRLPDADIIIFNLETIGSNIIKRRQNKKIKRITIVNYMNYGAARIAFKRTSIINNNLFFNTQFGGGTRYSSGEDSIFLADALRKKLKIYAYPKEIAKVNQQESTWFCGYNEKFFYDKGALLTQICPKTKYLFGLFYFPIRFKGNLSLFEKQHMILLGMKNYYKNINYEEYKKNIK